jgi:hypothetical protein
MPSMSTQHVLEIAVARYFGFDDLRSSYVDPGTKNTTLVERINRLFPAGVQRQQPHY